MMKHDIGLEEALARTLERLTRPAPVTLAVDEAGGLAVAEDCIAAVDCPSSQVSLKDGYAVVSADLANVSQDRPAKLRLAGTVVAGGQADVSVDSGTAVKIMTGARIPRGADAVVSNEFTEEDYGWILCCRDARPGRNTIERGYDVKKGERIACSGEILTPAKTGLLAAGGISTVRVHRLPRIAVLAVGDEVVGPGNPLKQGQLYASNVVTLLAWLRHFRMEAEITIVPDNKKELCRTMESVLGHADVLITCGGAWKSERDLTIRTLQEMGGDIVFHRVRMGPGKAVALVLLNEKTVFCLPGGPPSNEIAFLQIALPGLFHLAGRDPVPFELKTATLTVTVTGNRDWTQLSYARLVNDGGQLFVRPLEIKSRLQSQASANALIKVPEGVKRLEEGKQIQVQVLFSEIHENSALSKS